MSQQNKPTAAPVHIPKRFTVFQRVEHIVLILSFTTLAVTGLVQKFSSHPIAAAIIELFGGIETTRVIHHIAAIALALMCIYHVIVLAHKVYVRRVELSMLPGSKDIIDALDLLRYNLGLSAEHPKMPRYNFGEKVEYWAMVWGTIIMGLTGFMLWNPIIVTKILPGQFIPAAKAAHGGEAILAVLAILIWHFYHVHIKSLNKSMFTGKMSLHQMKEEHGEELERIMAGKMRPAPNPEGVRRRERIFIPFAIIASLVMVAVVYWLATAETTAIATLPQPTARPAVFVPLTPTPAPSVTVDNGKIGGPIPHPIAGQEKCDTCHATDGVRPMPANHQGRPVESCLVCHQPGPTPTPGGAGGPGPIPHPIEGDTYQDCAACHGVGKLRPFPENHASFTTTSCTGCHAPAAAAPSAGETPAAGGTPQAGETPGIRTPRPIPHAIEGATYQDCTVCHSAGKLKPFPENHAGFTITSCTACHQPAAATATP